MQCDFDTHKWLTTVISTRTRVILHAECDFDTYECDCDTHECDYDTHECDLYTHELNFNTMRVTLTQNN
jgi:hypothetical protein